jgi:hypothetical protein
LESSKRKRKTSEGVSNAEVEATSGLAALSKKKSKKVVKKVRIIQCVAPAFSDDEAEDEPHQSGYPLVIGMIVPKEGNAFGLWPLELDSGFAELSGGSDNISWIGCDC